MRLRIHNTTHSSRANILTDTRIDQRYTQTSKLLMQSTLTPSTAYTSAPWSIKYSAVNTRQCTIHNINNERYYIVYIIYFQQIYVYISIQKMWKNYVKFTSKQFIKSTLLMSNPDAINLGNNDNNISSDGMIFSVLYLSSACFEVINSANPTVVVYIARYINM